MKLKTKDGVEINQNDTVYDNWGKPLTVTAIIRDWQGNPKSIYLIPKNKEDGTMIRHVCSNTVYSSQINALNCHLEYVTRKVWELEREAQSWRNHENESRLKIIELEKIEEQKRQALENEEDTD